jgi:hypothetical protein
VLSSPVSFFSSAQKKQPKFRPNLFYSTTYLIHIDTLIYHQEPFPLTSRTFTINMAPLPAPYSAVACTSSPTSTSNIFHLAAHTLTTSNVSPVAAQWHAGLPNYKRWVDSSIVGRDDDDYAAWKTVDGNDDGDHITIDQTPADEPELTPTTDENGNDNDTFDNETDEPETAVEEISPDEATPTPTSTGEGDDEDTDNKPSVDDAPLPTEAAGTEASADTITSKLVEKHGTMPTSIDECIDTEDEIVTYTDENGNNNVTVNCTALANMETWYFLPCDAECHDDLDEIIPGVVVSSGLSGGLLPTILNNHGLWGNNPVSQTAIINWLTNHLQRVRSLLSNDVFDWTRVQSNAEELMNHPPVDLPLENDALPAPEGAPEVATPEAIEAAETAVEEAANALENIKHMTKSAEAIQAAEEHIAEQKEKLRQLKENVPSEEALPSDPFEPVEPVNPADPVEVDPGDLSFSPEEIAAWTKKLKEAVDKMRAAMRNYQSREVTGSQEKCNWLERQNGWRQRKSSRQSETTFMKPACPSTTSLQLRKYLASQTLKLKLRRKQPRKQTMLSEQLKN